MKKAPNILHNPFGAVVVALLGPALAFVGGVVFVSTSGHREPAQVAAATSALFPPAVVLPEGALQAKAALMYDPRSTRILYQKNAHVPLPLASLTKLATAETVLAAAEPSTPVVLAPEDIRVEGDSGLVAGQTMTLDELITYALVASSNDAITAAARSLGPNYLAEMNLTAERLGLAHTRFLNPTGLDIDETTPGAVGSAYDMARLGAAFFASHPDFFETTNYTHVGTLAATAAPLFNLPGLIGAKTGYTDLAGGNLVAVFDLQIGYPVVVVVLGSTRDGRFDDMRTLIEAARDTIDP